VAAPKTSRAAFRASLTLWVCSALHTVNDAFFALIFPLLPLLAADLDLSYAEVGLIKTTFSGASSALQLPVGLLAERWGEYMLLVGGNAWVAAGLIGMGLSTSYLPLLAMALLAGLGGNTQHPLAASLVSNHAAPERRATAVGTLNFAGDLGKIAAPPLVALVALPFGWRAALISLGVFGLLFSIAILRLPVGRSQGERETGGRSDRRTGGRGDAGTRETPAHPVTPSARPPVTRWGLDQPGRYAVLAALGLIDSATRGAALAFLPFLLSDKGLDPVEVSWLFTVVFVGGAVGKFGCGYLGDRFGATGLILVTEVITIVTLMLFPGSPVLWLPVLALGFGFALNGTSSVLYAMVAELVSESRRSRGYGLYYTLVNGSSAAAPVLYGLLGDRAGLLAIFPAMAAVTAMTLPLAVALRRRT
jgi:MFS transporter, FSR family, fosmidomycin resistance protein